MPKIVPWSHMNFWASDNHKKSYPWERRPNPQEIQDARWRDDLEYSVEHFMRNWQTLVSERALLGAVEIADWMRTRGYRISGGWATGENDMVYMCFTKKHAMVKIMFGGTYQAIGKKPMDPAWGVMCYGGTDLPFNMPVAKVKELILAHETHGRGWNEKQRRLYTKSLNWNRTVYK